MLLPMCNEPSRYANRSSDRCKFFFVFGCEGVCACVEVTTYLTLRRHSTTNKTQHEVQHQNAERLNETHHHTTKGRGAQRRHPAKSKADHYIRLTSRPSYPARLGPPRLIINAQARFPIVFNHLRSQGWRLF
jgi:hypothetical protein